MNERSASDVVAEMFERQRAGDDMVLDDLVAEDMINHAAGPQGRNGLKHILTTIDHDLGPVTVEQHHLIGDGDLVAHNMSRFMGGIAPRRCRCSQASTSRNVLRHGRSSTSGASTTV